MSYTYASPDSNTNGVEAEGNVAVTRALAFNANGTFGTAKYEASAGTPAVIDQTTGTTITPATNPSAAAWVALAPHDTESAGMTYQQSGIDFGIFGKRVGSRWNDIKSFHQVVPLDSFWMSNVFVNYNVTRSMFAGSKIKLSINNLFDDHSIVANSAANDATNYNGVVGTKVTQSLQRYPPSWNDSIQKQAGRSIMVSVTFGLTRQER